MVVMRLLIEKKKHAERRKKGEEKFLWENSEKSTPQWKVKKEVRERKKNLANKEKKHCAYKCMQESSF